MKRVSSRQRLVSWDAFEANASPSAPPQQEEEGSFDDAVTTLSFPNSEAPFPNDHHDIRNTVAAPHPTSLLLLQDSTEGSFLSSQSDDTFHSTISSACLKRKRHASPPSQKNMVSTTPDSTMEAFPWDLVVEDTTTITEIATTTKEDEPAAATALLSVNDDVKLRILSFLDTDTVRTMMQVSKEGFYNLIASDQASLLWKQYCATEWPFCEHEATEFVTSIKSDNTHNIINSSDHPLPLAGNGGYQRHTLNFNAILQAAPATCPTRIDESIFAPCRWSRSLRRYRHRRTPLATELQTVRWVSGNDNDGTPTTQESAVQFTGTIGTGDRCIRSDQPFGRPRKMKEAEKEKERAFSSPKAAFSRFFRGSNQNRHPQQRMEELRTTTSSSPRSPRQFFLEHLRRRAESERNADRAANKNDDINLEWKPFVVPFVVSKQPKHSTTTMSVTPRLVHYYEVSILAPPETPETRPSTLDQDGDNARRNWSNDCVAVGISTNQFSLHTRMVGWDDYSYGYHGDDGGVFHHTGHMLREYGPKFGAGDVVGCGIDYHRNVLFFTRNGKYLGDAFDLKGGNNDDDSNQTVNFYDHDWYPTVGIDTKCLVQCNFGTEKPFAFDLEAFMGEKHADVRRHVQQDRLC